MASEQHSNKNKAPHKRRMASNTIRVRLPGAQDTIDVEYEAGGDVGAAVSGAAARLGTLRKGNNAAMVLTKRDGTRALVRDAAQLAAVQQPGDVLEFWAEPELTRCAPFELLACVCVRMCAYVCVRAVWSVFAAAGTRADRRPLLRPAKQQQEIARFVFSRAEISAHHCCFLLRALRFVCTCFLHLCCSVTLHAGVGGAPSSVRVLLDRNVELANAAPLVAAHLPRREPVVFALNDRWYETHQIAKYAWFSAAAHKARARVFVGR